MTNLPEYPARFINRDEARRRYGRLADRYGAAQLRGDPAADAVVAAYADRGGFRQLHADVDQALDDALRAPEGAPEALEVLLAHSREVPDWVDFDLIRHGALTYQRIGPAGMLILSAWSLMNGYHCAPAIKPLVYTRALEAKAPRRLAETARFVVEVAQIGGLERGGRGVDIAVKVRLMHAMVRAQLSRSEWWQTDQWGVPINQADMLGTVVEFSLLVIEGAKKMGFVFTRREQEAVLHMWRYAGWLSGVEPSLLDELSDYQRGVTMAELIHLVQPGPDDDSVALACALRAAPASYAKTPLQRRLVPFVLRYHDGLIWVFNGDEVARSLQIPNRHWRLAIHPTRALVRGVETLRRRIPGATSLLARLGNRVLCQDVERMLEAREPSFEVRGESGPLRAA